MIDTSLPQSIRKLHESFENGTWTPLTITEAYLKRAKLNRLNAWITVCEERAINQAKALTALLVQRGQKVPREEFPLFGVPAGIKDNIAVADVRMTCASRLLEGYISPYSATVVKKLELSGAITLGKLNMDEFAMGGSNENSAFGRVLHPTHPDRIPGGSSGGSAAAVAGEECLIALGSDTGGSIRLPASYCGTVGFKPTYGAVSRFGLVAFASSLDQVGPLTRSVEDSIEVLQVISGEDRLDSTSVQKPSIRRTNAESLQGLRVGLPVQLGHETTSTGVKKAIDEAITALIASGAEVIPVALPHIRHSIAVYYVIAVSEASSNLSRFDGVRFGARAPDASSAQTLEGFHAANRSFFGPEVKRRILLGTFSLSSGYSEEYFLKASQVRALIARDLTNAFQNVDCLISPNSVTTAFRAGEKSHDPLQMYLNDLFTIPANLAGIPAISLPWCKDEAGLPVGIQIMAPQGEDARLLAVAGSLEALRTSSL